MPDHRPLPEYRLTPAAQDDLAAIWSYTARAWSPDQAEAYLLGLRDVLENLLHYPEIAREHTELSPPVRLHPYGSHLIMYRIEANFLNVLRVLHNRQHWRALFE